ncbi:MAG: GDP-mannose 4,6-dehydratase [Nannocystis sp.]|nr:GDP-mannose 4,6-dehydratase [Nannocystis sp.]
MKVLVTGAMGFIGSNLVPALVRAGHVVTGIDNLVNVSVEPFERIRRAIADDPQWADNFYFAKADIRNEFELKQVFANHEFDAVVNLAALGSVPRSFQTPQKTVETNEFGFANVLKVMSEFKVGRLVYASSSSVYGDSQKHVKIEGEEGRALNPYALSKQMNEAFAGIYGRAKQINCVGLRFFNVYGPGQLPFSEFSAVIPKFINTTPKIFGDGSTTRDFTFVSDVVDAIGLSLAFSENESAVLNVGTGTGTSLKQLVMHLSKTAEQLPERLGDVRYSVASTTLCERTIGFKAKIEIAEGLKLTKAFYESELHRGKTC